MGTDLSHRSEQRNDHEQGLPHIAERSGGMSGERNVISDVVPFCQLGTGGWHEACYGWAVKVQPLAWVLNKRLRPLFLTLGSSGFPKLFRYGALAQFARGLGVFVLLPHASEPLCSERVG